MTDADMMPLVTALVAAIAFAAVAYALLYPYFADDRKDKRLASVAEAPAKKANTRNTADAAANRRKQVAANLKELEARQKSKERVTLRLMLEQAGFESDPKPFYIASAISGAVCFIVATLSLPDGPFAPILRGLIAFIGAFGLPRFVLKKLIERRQKKFVAELANAIDIIVRGIKSGLPLNECLAIIANECPDPVGYEFREVVEQQRIGVTLGEALDRMTKRVPIQDVKFLAIVIAIQQQSGGNLAEALGNLSTLLRDRFKMKMKVKALASEAKASAGILAALPPGVVVMMNSTSPEYIAPIFDTRSGNFILLVGLFWMGIGIMIMRKMINFKF